MKRCFLIVLLTFIKVFCYAYLPIVDHYPFEKNGSGPENWDVCEVGNYQLAFANQEGLLTFDGTEWNSINNGPRTIKSLFYDTVTKRTYAGSKGDFGYFIREKGTFNITHYKKTRNTTRESCVENLEV